jgi:hypothetical protein
MSHSLQQEYIDEEIKKEEIIHDIKKKVNELNNLFREAALVGMDVNLTIKDGRSVNSRSYPCIQGNVTETYIKGSIHG